MKKKKANRAVDGSKQLTDAERLKKIRQAFIDCGIRKNAPKLDELVANQFKFETGRSPGEKPKLRGSKARMW